MEPLIIDSARKHGIADEDILHALNNPMRYQDLDEGFVLVIGPTRSAQLIELGLLIPTRARASSTRCRLAEST